MLHKHLQPLFQRIEKHAIDNFKRSDVFYDPKYNTPKKKLYNKFFNEILKITTDSYTWKKIKNAALKSKANDIYFDKVLEDIIIPEIKHNKTLLYFNSLFYIYKLLPYKDATRKLINFLIQNPNKIKQTLKIVELLEKTSNITTNFYNLLRLTQKEKIFEQIIANIEKYNFKGLDKEEFIKGIVLDREKIYTINEIASIYDYLKKYFPNYRLEPLFYELIKIQSREIIENLDNITKLLKNHEKFGANIIIKDILAILLKKENLDSALNTTNKILTLLEKYNRDYNAIKNVVKPLLIENKYSIKKLESLLKNN